MKVDGAGNQVFTNTTLTREQYGGTGGRQAHDGGENLLHNRAAAHDVVELIALAEFFAQLYVLIPKRAYLQRFGHHGGEVIKRKGLQEEVHRAGLHRLYRIL